MYVLWVGERDQLRTHSGWMYIVAGFALTFLGSVIDITDNFDGLNRYVVIGDTAPQAVIEKVVGNLLGWVLLLVGLWHWLPVVVAMREAERELKEHGQYLAGLVEERTLELEETNRRIVRSLEEKDVLLKEIHHRVKNNLQIVSSLLHLQSEYVEDEQAFNMFRDAQNRVRSMALIHEKLYQTDNLARVDFGQYVDDLVADQSRAYMVDPAAVAIEVEIEDAFLGIDTAIPCALVVNELVSNALKYAFPNGGSGKVGIAMRATEERRFTLMVSDNGVGLPADLDWRNTESLGMQLVSTLTNQLDATVELDGNNGTRFNITFEQPE